MKKLEILGTGCPKCQQLAEVVKKAADGLGLEYEIVKVTNMNDIMKYGVMMTPALAVDGTVKVVGKVPNEEEIRKMIS